MCNHLITFNFIICLYQDPKKVQTLQLFDMSPKFLLILVPLFNFEWIKNVPPKISSYYIVINKKLDFGY